MTAHLSVAARRLLSCLVLLPALLHAQTEPTPVPADSIPVQPLPESAPAAPVEEAKPGPQQLGEVVVTAQKTRQSLRRVPASVTALTGDFIKQTGAADLADVSLYVPNVRVDADDPGSPQVFIRGFGTNAFNPSFESSVGFVQDDIYFGRPAYFTESLFDVDRVEILRGPQGTLFGKNTIAGVFNVISKGPTGDPTADARYLYGSHGEQRLEGGLGGMFGESFGARAGFLYRAKDGELYNRFLDRYEDELQQQAVRGRLRLVLGGGLETELLALTSETDAPFWPYQLMRLDEDTRTYLEAFDPNIEDDPYNFRTSFDTVGFIEKGSDTVASKTQWNAGELGGLKDFNTTLVLAGSKLYIDQLNELDVSPADIARLDNHERHKQFSAELRFSGKSEGLFGLGTGVEFVSGLFHFDSRYDLLARVLAGRDLGSYVLTDDAAQLASDGMLPGSIGFLGLPGVPALAAITGPLLTDGDFYQFDYRQDIRADALFGQMTWNLTKEFAITPGLRLGMEKKVVDAKGQSHCQTKDALPPGAPATPCVMEQLLGSMDYDQPNQVRKEYDVSPKLALQYFAGHGVNYYVSYARGDKSGGFNAISLTGENLEYQAETAHTYEVGARGRFFNRTLNANLTLYQTDFDNLQVLAFNGLLFDVSNAGKARSRGVEADIQWLTPFRPLRILGSLGLLDARYREYPGAPAPISEGVGATQNLDGRRIAFAPKATGTLTPTLSHEVGALAVSLSGDLIYQGEQYTDTDLDPNTRVPAYWKYAARLTLGDVRERWTLSLGGTNLSDKRVLNQVTDATFFPGTYFAQQAAGRSLFATLAVKL